MKLRRPLVAWTVAALALPVSAWALQTTGSQQNGGNGYGQTSNGSGSGSYKKHNGYGQKGSGYKRAGQGLDYNYVGGQIGYGDFNPDGPRDNNGFSLQADGSGDIAPHVNILGHYNHIFGSGTDTNIFSLGAGYHTNLNDKTNMNTPVRLDAFGDASFEYLNLDHNNGSSDNYAGVGFRGGLRAKFTRRVAADGSIGYVTYGSQNGPVFTVGGTYKLSQRLGLRASYRHYSLSDMDIDTVLVGARYYFR